ncbi:MAG: 16S rRNA (cytidine(1402)-2'-O)-methyltransferase [Pseudomonadota bacterium]
MDARGLQVVATPIGHLGDLSPRAAEALGGADAVACEDTRRTGRLLEHIGVHPPMVSLHEHNERDRIAALVGRLEAGETIALVSDAGTPLVSDPGFRLVRAAREAGVRVTPIPGPSALLAALMGAGIPSDRFCFEGFLPAKAGPRRQRLADLAGEPRTLVLFEAPHRIEACLADLAAAFGEERPATLARELTKRHETFLGPDLGALVAAVAADANQRRGEMVLVVGGAPAPDPDALDEATRRLVTRLAAELPPRRAAAVAADITGARRNTLYRYLQEGEGEQ